MKKLIVVILMLAIPVSICYASNSKTEVRVSVNDGTTNVIDTGLITDYFATGATQMETVAITAGSSKTLTVPSGAKAVLVDVGTYESLHLMGGTTDKGISLDNTCPLLMPISVDNAQITISSESAAASVKVYWL